MGKYELDMHIVYFSEQFALRLKILPWSKWTLGASLSFNGKSGLTTNPFC